MEHPMTDERSRLATLAASGDPDDRRSALAALEGNPEPWAVHLLRGLLKDPLAKIRSASVQALERRAAILTQPTMEVLVAIAERDPDLETRRGAVRALGSMLSVPTAPRRHVIRRVLRSAFADLLVRLVAQRALSAAEGPTATATHESRRKASARQRLAGDEPPE
jgi:hypothetical protein